MANVVDSLGRTFNFNRIRFSMDEELLQQAAQEVLDQTKERAQILFERYCHLHFRKYRRNYEPLHFRNGRMDSHFTHLYSNPNPVIRITIDITEGPLFEKFAGSPVELIEAAVKREPREWIKFGKVVAEFQ